MWLVLEPSRRRLAHLDWDFEFPLYLLYLYRWCRKILLKQFCSDFIRNGHVHATLGMQPLIFKGWESKKFWMPSISQTTGCPTTGVNSNHSSNCWLAWRIVICLGVVIAKSLRFILVYGTWGLCKNFLGKSEFGPQIFGLNYQFSMKNINSVCNLANTFRCYYCNKP